MSISLDTDNSLLGADLTLAKLYLGVDTSDTSSDDIITQSVNAASVYCNNYTRRELKSREHTEYYSGDGSSTLYTEHFPITAISSAYDDLDRDYDSDSEIDTDDLVIEPAVLKFRITYDGGVFTKGYNNIKLVYMAGYSSIPADLQEACLGIMATMFYASEEKRLGVNSKSSGTGNIGYTNKFADWILTILDEYRRKW